MFALDQVCGARSHEFAPDIGPALSAGAPALFGAGVRSAPAGAIQLGAVAAAWQAYPDGQVQRFGADNRIVRLIVPITGAATMVCAGETSVVQTGRALLVAKQKSIACRWSADSVGLVLEMDRGTIQERCFVRYREPRRLAAMCHVIDRLDPGEGIGAALVSLSAILAFRFEKETKSAVLIGENLVDGLVGELMEAGVPGLFSFSGSVRRALAALESAAGPIDVAELARSAGITLPNLRRNVRECTGTTLVKLVQDAQLDRARSWLSSDRESRSIEQIASTCGFGRSGSFAQAYRRRFEETPTQTRARIFTRG